MQSKGNKWCFVIVAGLRLYLHHCSHLFPVGNARRRLICGNGCAQLVPAAEVFRTEGWQQGPKRPLRQWQSNRVLRLGHINFCSSTGTYFASFPLISCLKNLFEVCRPSLDLLKCKTNLFQCQVGLTQSSLSALYGKTNFSTNQNGIAQTLKVGSISCFKKGNTKTALLLITTFIFISM